MPASAALACDEVVGIAQSRQLREALLRAQAIFDGDDGIAQHVAALPRRLRLFNTLQLKLDVRARGGELYVFADADSEMSASEGVHLMRLPEHYGQLSALLHVIPLQILAYHVALVRGTDVDKPRNLAKSVTVE